MSGSDVAAGRRRDHEAACLSEGICPDHLVPFVAYGQMFDFAKHRYQCAQCGLDVVWVTGIASGPSRVQFEYADQLAWEPAT